MNKEQEKIGKFIADLRHKKGLTQDEFARLLGTSQSAVTRMEKGEQNFSTEMLSKISRVLNRNIISLSGEALNLKIEGGRKLSGTATVKTSKNAAVALLCASLLNSGKTILKNIPRIEEVNRIIEVLVSLGVSVKWVDGNDLEIVPPKKINIGNINVEAAMRTRSVVMLLGPLIHLLDKFQIPYPGGCKLGTRTVRPHLFALEKLGVGIVAAKGNYNVSAGKPRSRTSAAALSGNSAKPAEVSLRGKLYPSEIVLYESGDTVTENVLMATARIDGVTIIKFASANYQVQDICFFLAKLGVKIEGIGTTTLTVHGKPEIDADVEYAPSEDPIEAMLFLSIAATTNSSIIIERCPIDFLELELLKLEKMGFRYKILKRYKAKNEYTNLVDIQTLPSKLKALEEKIYARPFPGLNIDNLPFFVPIVTQAKGRTLIHDWVYENRALYYTELAKLGANVILADPHRVYIEGPTELKAAEVVCPPALRPAAIILVGMLAARGTSILRNVYSINRGYEDLCARLNKLGAKIQPLREF